MDLMELCDLDVVGVMDVVDHNHQQNGVYYENDHDFDRMIDHHVVVGDVVVVVHHVGIVIYLVLVCHYDTCYDHLR